MGAVPSLFGIRDQHIVIHYSMWSGAGAMVRGATTCDIFWWGLRPRARRFQNEGASGFRRRCRSPPVSPFWIGSMPPAPRPSEDSSFPPPGPEPGRSRAPQSRAVALDRVSGKAMRSRSEPCTIFMRIGSWRFSHAASGGMTRRRSSRRCSRPCGRAGTNFRMSAQWAHS
jgi:hypothetical protein